MKEKLIAGLDEVGWGSPAGPIVSVVVVMKASDRILLPKGVTDSKKLTTKKREMFFLQLCAAVTDYGLGSAEPEEIDTISPKFALQATYTRALAELKTVPDELIVDGTDWTNLVKTWKGPQMAVPKADLKHIEVSVASIIAKVMRDKVMDERAALLKAKYGLDYNWEVNKGYLTKDHVAAIEKNGLLFGPGPELYQHRKTYCGNMLGKVKIYGKNSTG